MKCTSLPLPTARVHHAAPACRSFEMSKGGASDSKNTRNAEYVARMRKSDFLCLVIRNP